MVLGMEQGYGMDGLGNMRGNVDFRVGPYGQLAFTYEGEDYYVQYMPVGMQEIVCPPDFLIAQMTYAGVDRTILQAGGGYGAMNDYNAFAQSQHPGWSRVYAQVLVGGHLAAGDEVELLVSTATERVWRRQPRTLRWPA